MPADTNTLGRKLFATTDGQEAARLVRRLVKLGAQDPAAIQVLMEYAAKGSLRQWREFVVPDILRLVGEGEEKYRGFFEEGLHDPVRAYWSVEGLIKTVGSSSYSTLTQFALDAGNATDARAKAIKCLADHSHQTFIAGLPSDPGQWQSNQLPLDELRNWASAGYPEGRGFPSPPRHPDLDAPVSKLDQVAQRLDKKLAKARAAHQDLANPSNWLTPAKPEDLSRIESRWPLPGLYVEFLRKYSPLKVTITSRQFDQGLVLFGAHNLLQAQEGYSFNPVLNEPITDWPAHYVVIAAMAGDPFVLDLSNTFADDAPVLSADHGQGVWDFDVEFDGFLSFLRELAK